MYESEFLIFSPLLINPPQVLPIILPVILSDPISAYVADLVPTLLET